MTSFEQNWSAVNKLMDRVHSCWVNPGGGIINETRPTESYNLPLVLSYAVLDEALSILRDQGVFNCNDWQLDKKMKASKDKLPWVNYNLIDEGKRARNKLAHRAELLSEAECRKYVSAVEAELKAWGLI